VSRALPARRKARHDGGQSLVEFAMIVPVFLMLLLGLTEFGFVFTHHLTLEYATREGARMGAALASGNGSTVPCADVDGYVIAAVQRVLTSPGSQVPASRVNQIRIYKSDASGNQIGSSVNVWVPGSATAADGTALVFQQSGSTGWNACGRNNATANPDSIGIQLSYTYDYVTPLGSLLGIAGAPQIAISDRTIMALNPSD
jgi:Flp pilus assembly protein TadG